MRCRKNVLFWGAFPPMEGIKKSKKSPQKIYMWTTSDHWLNMSTKIGPIPRPKRTIIFMQVEGPKFFTFIDSESAQKLTFDANISLCESKFSKNWPHFELLVSTCFSGEKFIQIGSPIYIFWPFWPFWPSKHPKIDLMTPKMTDPLGVKIFKKFCHHWISRTKKLFWWNFHENRRT